MNKTQVGWAVRDQRWDGDDRWHVVGMNKPQEAAGRTILPVYIIEPEQTAPEDSWVPHIGGSNAPIDVNSYVDIKYFDGSAVMGISVRSVNWNIVRAWRKYALSTKTISAMTGDDMERTKRYEEPFTSDALKMVEDVRKMLGAAYGIGHDAPTFFQILQARNKQWEIWARRYIMPHNDIDILQRAYDLIMRATTTFEYADRFRDLINDIKKVLHREEQALSRNRGSATEVSETLDNRTRQAPLSDKD